MAGKKGGKSKGNKSAGIVTQRKKKRSETSFVEREIYKLKAFHEGKRVYFTIPNPNKSETNKRWIRVLGSTLYGDWREHSKHPTI